MNTHSTSDWIEDDNVTANGSTLHNMSDLHEDHGVHLANWRFDYVAAPLIVCVFLITGGALKLGTNVRIIIKYFSNA